MLDWIIALYLPLTCITLGPTLGGTTLTAAALLSAVGCVLTCVQRMKVERPIVSLHVLAQPAVICCLAYFAIGVVSGFCAADKDSYMHEVVQRMLIILMPLYLYVFGPRHPRVLMRAMLYYIPLASVIAGAAFLLALKTGLHQPVYLFGMHKNVVGADSAHLVLICAALLITRQFPQRRMILLALIGLGVLGIIGGQARAALLGTILGVFLMMLANRVRVRYVLIVALALVCGLGTMIIALPKDTIEYAVTTRRFSSNGIRKDTWRIMSEKLKKDPLMCVGWGNPISGGSEQSSGEQFVGDAASIFYLDWAQMSFVGVLAQFAMFGTCIYLPFSNARRCDRYSALSAINLAAMGIMAARFEQSYLDSFWIGRGPTLAAWAAAGMAIFVRLWLNQSEDMRKGTGKQTRVSAISKGLGDAA